MLVQKRKRHFFLPCLILAVIIVSLLIAPKSSAQFKIKKIESDLSFFKIERNKISFNPIFGYNRVQGAIIGLNFSAFLARIWNLELTGQAAYGFKDALRYRAGIRKSFFQFNPLTFGIAYYDQVSSQDDWYIGYNENSAAAFFLKEDFMDYHARKGVVAFIDQKINEVHTVRLEVNNYQFESLSKSTNWALFGKKKNFRENSSVVEENVTSLCLLWTLDWRDNPLLPMEGWYIEGKGEQTFGDSADTRGLFLTVKRFQPTFASHLMKLKLMIGSRTGCDYRYDQYLMDMGGIGSLVAYKDKEFRNGNRFFYATFRYLFNESILPRLPLNFIPFYDQLTLGVFAETGWLGLTDENSNLFSDFNSMTLSELKSDVGISLYVTEGLIRFDFAKRTDLSKDAWRITFRIMHQF